MKNNSATIIWFVVGLALLSLGCSSATPLFTTAGRQSGDWPQSRFILAQPAVSVAGESVYRTRFAVPNQTESSLMMPTRVPALEAPPPEYPRRRIQIRVGEPIQLDTSHLSPFGVKAVELTVNGQPVGVGDNPFPNLLVTVGVCSTEWVGSQQVCPKENLAQVSKIEMDPTLRFNHISITLIVTGRVPGTYQLALNTTHWQNEQQNQIVQMIEVVN